MKRRILFLLLAIFTLSFTKAQDTITLGTGTSSLQTLALPGYYGFNYSANLFTADEFLNVGGEISSILIESGDVISASGRKLKIYMKEVDFQTLPATLIFDDLIEDATLVYNDSNLVISSNIWNEFELDEPFVYTGAGNLLIIYEGQACGSGGGCSAYTKYNSAITGKAWNYCKDYSPLNTSVSETSYNSYRTNTKF